MDRRELSHIPLFEILTDDELQWLIDNTVESQLAVGDYFIREGDPAEQFYVVLEGELQVVRTIDGVPKVMGTTPRGIIGGELALLNGTPSMVTVKAIRPSRLIVFNKRAFREMFTYIPAMGIKVLRIAAERMGGFATTVTQNEKMAALGKFSAGLAHELNNPSAAARRSSQALYELMPDLQRKTLHLCRLGLNDAQLHSLMTLPYDMARDQQVITLTPIQRSELEDEIGDWLNDHGIKNGWEIAPIFVDAGIELEQLQTLAGLFPADGLADVFDWLQLALNTAALLREIEDSSTRISDLVLAIKEYTYMDQGKLQEVDLNHGLENTLRVLHHKLKNVEVIREYDVNLPKIMGNGGELNQVWTNLIDNAIDATDGKGQIHVITRCENDYAMVEITDDGPGIPQDQQARIFEPFFTTKAFGKGTGLGLDITYRIVQRHKGTIELHSKSGQTRFIVRIPVDLSEIED